MAEVIETVTIDTQTITVTETAQNHFRELLKKEAVEGMNLRAFAANPGTAHAEVAITFCPSGEAEAQDIVLSFGDFILYLEANSKAPLENATIDFIEDALGGQLSIKAPFLKGRTPAGEATLSERIQHVIDSEINPNLASHGGKVALIEILPTKDEAEVIVVLQMGGGCQGCGMAQSTLKNGIEKTLKEKFPEILEIRDATDHTTGENPYY
jgi:Fe/S biogenesis protein NfuA